MILEPIPWRNAVHVVPVEFLRRLRDICTRKSICLIFDEVQNGFGFTGAIWYERYRASTLTSRYWVKG